MDMPISELLEYMEYSEYIVNEQKKNEGKIMANFNIAYIYSLKDKFSSQMDKINAKVGQNSKQVQNLKKDILAVSSAYKKIALIGVGAFTGLIVAASKFQAGLTDTLTLLSSDDIKKFEGYLSKAQHQGVKLGFSLNDTSKALFDTVSAIGDVETSLKIFQMAQRLAIGGNAELSVAVDGITSIMNAYGKELTDATEVGNAFFSAQRVGKTTVSELALHIGKVAPIAKQAGVSFQTLQATLAQLTLGGLKTEESATALRMALVGLMKPTEVAKKVLEKYNIPMGASALRASDFTDTLNKLAVAAKENPDALAEMIPSVSGLVAISALGTKEIDNIRQTIRDMSNDVKFGTGLNEALARKMQDTAQQFKMAKGEFLATSAAFGKHLLPMATAFLKVLNKIFNLFNNLNPATQKFILILGAVVVGFTGLIAVVSIWLKMKATIIASNAVIAGSFKVLWASITGPIGLIIAGVLTLIAVGVLLYKKWKPFKILVDNIWDKIKQFGGFLKGLGGKIFGADIPKEMKINQSMSSALQGQNGRFSADINLNAPKGAVQSVQTKEKKASGFNLGFNMREEYA